MEYSKSMMQMQGDSSVTVYTWENPAEGSKWAVRNLKAVVENGKRRLKIGDKYITNKGWAYLWADKTPKDVSQSYLEKCGSNDSYTIVIETN